MPEDVLIDIGRRCDAIDKAPDVLTVAQRRGNLPIW